MPFSHHINAESGFAVIHLSGTVTGADLLDALAWFYAAADWAPGARVLWDGRAIDHFALSSEEFEKASELVEGAVGRLAMARTAVVTQNLEAYMSGSLLASRLGRRTGREARAFTDLLAALEWLAAPDAPLLADAVLPNDLGGDGLRGDLGPDDVEASYGTVGGDRSVGGEGPEGAD